MNLVRRLGVPLAAAMLAALIATALAPAWPTVRANGAGGQHDLKPLVSTHEFMEHVIEGTFATLKKGLSEKPADEQVWRSVRDTSLLLGECGNLLLIRTPDDADASDWSKLCIALRESGDIVSKAAKGKDYDASRSAYLELVHACNACHTKYGDDGEPKIVP